MSTSTKNIAVLISGNGSNLQALIEAQSHGHYRIKLVISNRPNAYGLTRAQQANIATHCLDHTQFSSRLAFDIEMMNIIDAEDLDFIVLSGFMRILTPEFTQHYLGKMINIHPSLLPKYPGLNTHQKALDAGDSEHGVSVHFVTKELDGGPIIIQAFVNIEQTDTLESLEEKIHQQEHKIYPLVVEWLATNQLALKNEQAYFNQTLLDHPIHYTPSLYQATFHETD